MKDLGEATYILGIRIYRDRPKRFIGLSQSLYLDKVLKRFNMLDSKRGLLPLRQGIHLSKAMSPKTLEERENMAKVLYASAIGSLMYFMLCTRPNITAFLCGCGARHRSARKRREVLLGESRVLVDKLEAEHLISSTPTSMGLLLQEDQSLELYPELTDLSAFTDNFTHPHLLHMIMLVWNCSEATNHNFRRTVLDLRVDLRIIATAKQEIHALVEVIPSHLFGLLSVVYACHNLIDRNNLITLSNAHDLPWTVLGDFNDILDPSEKLGGKPVDSRASSRSREIIEKCKLIDVGLSGLRFTWSNLRNRDGLIQECLDRVITNASSLLSFPIFKCLIFLGCILTAAPLKLTSLLIQAVVSLALLD
ncbi:hypothetical protein CRG98_014150 [Punica granatum]|uniref:Reverse transcriptase Ty1/copia-type domain-containing protein n=1 Tax=Punica granatum TaxID=22663 RepID=A0A2I0KA44_PUNGR|nr:hypothetical protein CRG98_014150 [Punica granatum]